MPTTLSPRQLEVLRRLAEPGARAEYWDGWRINGQRQTGIAALINDGLLTEYTGWQGRFATINDAGRAVVDNLTSEP